MPVDDLPILFRVFVSIDQLAIQRKIRAPQSPILNCQRVVEVAILVVQYLQYFPMVAEMRRKEASVSELANDVMRSERPETLL